MPKGIPKVKTPDDTPTIKELIKAQDKKIDDQDNKIDKLIDVVMGLADQLPTAPTIAPSPVTPNILPTPEDPEGFTASNEISIPAMWRAKINEILGEDFEATIEDSNGGSFILKIFLPKHLDRRKGEALKEGDKDMSSGIIRRATDMADVEMWCTRIKTNIQSFFPDFK